MDEYKLDMKNLAQMAHEANDILHSTEYTQPYKNGYLNGFLMLLCYNLDLLALNEEQLKGQNNDN